MGNLAGIKQIVCGSLVSGGLAVVLITQTASATPIIGVDTTNLAVGTFDGGLEATSKTNDLDVELPRHGPANGCPEQFCAIR
jgi:hypothetical protein